MKTRKWLTRALIILMVAINGASDGREINSMEWLEISRVNFDMVTIVKVRCDEFAERFKGEMKTFPIHNRTDIKRFSEILNGLTPSVGEGPDVRARVLVHYRTGEADTLCVGHTGILLNGMPMTPEKKMVSFIKNAKPSPLL